MELGPVNEKLTIVKLSLTGFVVDSYPFNTWFDRRRLREIHFMHDCIDAGFGLSTWQEPVRITYPREVALGAQYVTILRPAKAKLVVIGKPKSKPSGLRHKRGVTV